VSEAPDTYTHGHHDAVLRSHRWRTAENSAAYLLPWLRPGMRLLDVGCGPGTLTAGLAARMAPGPVVAIDTSAEVLDEARLFCAERGVENVTLVHGDFRTAGLPASSFDVVHAHQVLQHLRDPVGALRDMARLARPGGIVAARDVDFTATTVAPEGPGLDRLHSVYLAVTRRNGAEPNAGRWLPRWAREAGLSDVTYTTSTWTFATPEERAWWGELWAERFEASSLAEQALSYGVATKEELAEIAGGFRWWVAQPDGVFIVVHGEILARV
jgi:ubiquinone/menaquinone biosynthesis C-methylase UbiE